MSDATTDDRTQIWYATESDPFRALHDVFEVVRGDERQLFECGGWAGRSESCVTAALGAAGFVSGSAREISVRQISPEDGVDVIRHFGFYVNDSAVDAADEALRAGLRGDLGGWTSALMGQVGFHRSVLAFSHVWAAAGKPPILLAHPPRTARPARPRVGRPRSPRLTSWIGARDSRSRASKSSPDDPTAHAQTANHAAR